MTVKATATRLMVIAALCLLVACDAGGSEPTAVRGRDVVIEGDVREVVDRDGIRVGGSGEGDRGVLVLILDRRPVNLRDRVRIVGEPVVLQLAAVEERYGLDLDERRYRRLQGEEAVVAHTLTVISSR